MQHDTAMAYSVLTVTCYVYRLSNPRFGLFLRITSHKATNVDTIVVSCLCKTLSRLLNRFGGLFSKNGASAYRAPPSF